MNRPDIGLFRRSVLLLSIIALAVLDAAAEPPAGQSAHHRTPLLVTGHGPGIASQIRIYGAAKPSDVRTIEPYFRNFTGGARVAAGDTTGDGLPEIITAPGPGLGPQIKIFDSRTREQIAHFIAYQANFTGGAFVAAGDTNNDGKFEIITGPDIGGGPHVKATALPSTPVLSFFAYNPAFTGGVRVASADFNGDGHWDIVTSPGPGGGPHVRIFSGKDGSVLTDFFAYSLAFRDGVYVAAGDVNGDGVPEIVTGAGGSSSHVRVFTPSEETAVALADFFPFRLDSPSGVRVALLDLDGDSKAEIVTAPGEGSRPLVRIFKLVPSADPHTAPLQAVEVDTPPFAPYPQDFTGGVYLGG